MSGSSLLEFVMSLAHDPRVAAAYAADPEQVLHDSGLADVAAADIDALLPIADSSTGGTADSSIWQASEAAHAFDMGDPPSIDAVPDGGAVPVDQPLPGAIHSDAGFSTVPDPGLPDPDFSEPLAPNPVLPDPVFADQTFPDHAYADHAPGDPASADLAFAEPASIQHHDVSILDLTPPDPAHSGGFPDVPDDVF